MAGSLTCSHARAPSTTQMLQCSCQTPLQTFHQDFSLKILPDEYHPASVSLALLPHLSWFAIKDFMYALQSSKTPQHSQLRASPLMQPCIPHMLTDMPCRWDFQNKTALQSFGARWHAAASRLLVALAGSAICRCASVALLPSFR